MLKVEELEKLIDDPASVMPLIAERKEWKARLEELEPPFVAVTGQVPPVSEWKPRSAPAAAPAGPGDILTGLGACPARPPGSPASSTAPPTPPSFSPARSSWHR